MSALNWAIDYGEQNRSFKGMKKCVSGERLRIEWRPWTPRMRSADFRRKLCPQLGLVLQVPRPQELLAEAG